MSPPRLEYFVLHWSNTLQDRIPKGCLPGFLHWLIPSRHKEEVTDQKAKVVASVPNYGLASSLMTPTEWAFFCALAPCAQKHRLFVAPKVRLADVLTVPPSPKRSQSAFNRIRSKHIDFALCSARDGSFVVAVELDDRSHERKAVRERDQFVDAALASAGLPILRFAASSRYERTEISGKLAQIIS